MLRHSEFSPYRGRFAPSPTGLMHAGSLMTAVGSFLEAKAHGGQWLVRIEDLDTPRMVPGAADEILRTLERFGFAWDGPVEYQSRRHALYREALDGLIRQGLAYGCRCSRREIQAEAPRGVDGFVYPGTCRERGLTGASALAWRLRVDGAGEVAFDDRLQGHYAQRLACDIGDFVLLRADGYWAYQLAVVVDDAEQGVTDVVRGADLLVSTPRQIWLQQCLHATTPGYCHLPLLVNAAGEKLSKQTLAPSISVGDALDELRLALSRLGHRPPVELHSLSDVWSWAHKHWRLAQVPKGPVLM
ncbi:tRNA glutamyl-Q(34) synthetase GluQRS [Paludibacterium purpuratum]|uniref:Glutamyl-Q tRNA(Asp) synthetase n=1 Tax=Paludibacterium purpuratum TaxID=1144873 RepID=A0A4R7AX53_9NEIS|nr:tRNA glutamyl-Q(34) synthetase GluQRS [Paludibacterium purpuratum]TDR71047.1 glutamyl-Q tRNA(Asp) synthetase [Paludibacterium purpuratum]